MTDYGFACARISVLEKRLPSKSRTDKWLSASDADELIKMMGECLPLSYDKDGNFLREKTLNVFFEENLNALFESAGRIDAVTLWGMPYDCNNVKAAVKATMRQTTPEYAAGGNIPVTLFADWQKDIASLGLPENMAKTVLPAYEEAIRTGVPGVIDYRLDNACYADMRAAAERTGNAWIMALVVLKIDLTNALTALRFIADRQKLSALSEDVWIKGGTFDASDYVKCKTVEDVCALVSHAPNTAPFVKKYASSSGRAFVAERLADDCVAVRLAEADFDPMGVGHLVAFRLNLETAVKNCRILIAGKKAGLSRGEIEERLRDIHG